MLCVPLRCAQMFSLSCEMCLCYILLPYPRSTASKVVENLQHLASFTDTSHYRGIADTWNCRLACKLFTVINCKLCLPTEDLMIYIITQGAIKVKCEFAGNTSAVLQHTISQ
jgi:hypothetical protein